MPARASFGSTAIPPHGVDRLLHDAESHALSPVPPTSPPRLPNRQPLKRRPLRRESASRHGPLRDAAGHQLVHRPVEHVRDADRPVVPRVQSAAPPLSTEQTARRCQTSGRAAISRRPSAHSRCASAASSWRTIAAATPSCPRAVTISSWTSTQKFFKHPVHWLLVWYVIHQSETPP